MKDDILKRKMFSEAVSKDARNSGIMAGFEDFEEEDEEEGDESPMARTPQNPEILMNNLRGDIRSVDARYLELAQMVGEEAAMETPPEVLAMLQSQLSAQQAMPPMAAGGIGALPQAPEMAPPMMPPGMEGGLPFPQGGAEQAPPTPDGMPPMRAADGAFVTPGGRMEQFQSDLDRQMLLASGAIPPEQMTERDQQLLRQFNMGMGFTGGGIRNALSTEASMIRNALSPYVQRGAQFVDELAGRFLPPSFRAGPLRGADGKQVIIQGRESVVQGPRGPAMGEGTKLTRGQTLEYGQPPFSQVFREQTRPAVDWLKANPTAAKAAGLTAGAGTAAAALDALTTPPRQQPQGPFLMDQIPGEAPREVPAAEAAVPPSQATINQIMSGPGPDMGIPAGFGAESRQPPLMDKLPSTPAAKQDTAAFIESRLKDESKAKTRAERIKEEYGALEPTFRELLGDTKSEARTNALLLLADAGFKFASTYKPTMAMALGEALSGVPKGFAAIAAQAKDRDIKIKTAALNQAVDNVNLQDKYARDFQIEQLKGQYKTKVELLKGDYRLLEKQIENGSVIEEDAGMGLTRAKKKNGSVLDTYFKFTKDPVTGKERPPVEVEQALDSRFTLRPTDNPFVENRGAAPTTMERNEAERIKLGTTLRALDNSLQTLDNLKGEYTNLYSPGTWFTDKVNNLIVPVSGGLVRPDVNQEAAASRIRTGLNTVMKSIASANDQGRVAVQEQEWARDTLAGLTNPTAFFTNKEIAAKQFATMEAVLRNARQNVLTQLGYVKEDYVMSTPATGTQNDPFVIPSDPDAQRRMFVFLGSTIGNIQNPNATVYLRLPNGRVDAFNPTQLKGLIK